VDLTGKRVAVIGTGASAIQIVPELQQVAGHLDVYQRTAPWVIPRNDRPYGKLERLALRRIPGLQKLYRTGLYWAHEAYVPAFTFEPRIAAPARKVALGNIRKGIRDPALRERVRPHFEFGCKRVLRSNTYYPALDADNTDLVTDPIAKITGSAIVTADGTEREIDVLVVATGFYTTELPITEHVVGRDGRRLADRWRESGMAAYKGTTVPEFPNLFLLVGPNTGQGHTSMIFIIESQVAYVRDALRRMRRERLTSVEPTPEATERWNRSLQKRMGRTVWTTGGCQSWYLDSHGRNTTLWPRSTVDFRRRLASFDADAYQEVSA
jgi:cyclohexanone monooxygenase